MEMGTKRAAMVSRRLGMVGRVCVMGRSIVRECGGVEDWG